VERSKKNSLNEIGMVLEMDENRIKIKEFSKICEYTRRNIIFIRNKDPEAVGYDPYSKTYSRNKAEEIKQIRSLYTLREAAAVLDLSVVSVRNRIRDRKLNVGRYFGSRIFLNMEEIKTIGQSHTRAVKKYSPIEASIILGKSLYSVHYYVRKFALGYKIKGHVYLTWDEIRIIKKAQKARETSNA
jgi:hypothetical protein